MPRKSNKRRNRKQDDEGRAVKKPRKEPPVTEAGVPGNWSLTVKTNAMFEKYYKNQGIVPPEEWDAFMNAFRVELPTTFRISCIGGFHNRIQQELLALSEKKSENPEDTVGLHPLPWYPNQLGWQLDGTKRDLRKDPALKRIRDMLIRDHESGNINRQEAVSMIPPLLLDTKAHHAVLDMCAAPGSKTAQLLEALHTAEGEDGKKVSVEEQGITQPAGIVIANDADPRRAYMLVRMLKRYGSTNYLVTTHDAQRFPNLYLPTGVKDGREEGELMLFDRILCDVPCSGDGTLRKSPMLWKTWNLHIGVGLHPLQGLIAFRGAQLLKVGGMMVYSTCSLNPIENEAVVSDLLKKAGGALELVDVSDKLPGLIRSPGLHHWTVHDKVDAELKSIEDAPKQRAHKFRESMWPPTAEEAKAMHLERCIRILPHKQNTGGFFIALLRKTAELPQPQKTTIARNVEPFASEAAAPASDAAAATEGDATATTATAAPAKQDSKMDETADVEPAEDAEMLAAKLAAEEAVEEGEGKKDKKKKKPKKEGERDPHVGFIEDPYQPLATDALTFIRSFYGVADKIKQEHLFGRSDTSRRVYLVAPLISRILSSAFNTRLKIVHSGLRVFEYNPRTMNKDGWYRVAQEGVHFIAPQMTKQKSSIHFPEFMQLLQSGILIIKELADQKLRQDVEKLENGCIVLELTGEEQQAVSSTPVWIAAWKTSFTLNLMVAKEEQAAMVGLFRAALGLPVPAEGEAKAKAKPAAAADADAAAADAEPTPAPVSTQ